MSVVPIEELNLVDREAGRVQCPVLVFGNRAAELGADVRELGRVGTWEVSVHIYAFRTDDPATHGAFWDHYLRVGWLLFATTGPDDDPSWRGLVEKLTRALDSQPHRASVALLGDRELERRWTLCGGRAPLAVSEEPSPLVEAIVRDVLAQLR